jgi:uncharacterized membrane protein
MLAAIDGFPRGLTVAAAVGAAVVGGALFVFSAFVMPGLRRLSDRNGLRAMQAINQAAPASPIFVVALMGTTLLSIALAVVAIADLDEAHSPYLLVGSALYVAAVAITGVYHVPRNNALDLADPETEDGLEAWRAYVPGWVAWNHVRSLAAIAGSLAFILALGAD